MSPQTKCYHNKKALEGESPKGRHSSTRQRTEWRSAVWEMEMRREGYIKEHSRKKNQTSDSGNYLSMGFPWECNKASISFGMPIYFPSGCYSTKSGVYYNFTSLEFIYFITTVSSEELYFPPDQRRALTVVSFKSFYEKLLPFYCKFPFFVRSTKTRKKKKKFGNRMCLFFFFNYFSFYLKECSLNKNLYKEFYLTKN